MKVHSLKQSEVTSEILNEKPLIFIKEKKVLLLSKLTLEFIKRGFTLD